MRVRDRASHEDGEIQSAPRFTHFSSRLTTLPVDLPLPLFEDGFHTYGTSILAPPNVSHVISTYDTPRIDVRSTCRPRAPSATLNMT